jgi:tripartite-type tricarboxylate transporter receptor subunit TctC
MSENLGQQVIVENKLGAGGTIAATDVARSAPDGYTLMFHNVSTAAINMHVYKKLAYDPVKDFQPISRLADIPNVMIINKDVPAKTLREFIAYAKANPGKLNYASSGNGTILHLSGELFKQLAGVEMSHVPYKGSAPATVDLMGGTITMLFDNMPGQVENIRSGKVTGLGVTTGVRVPVVPDVPTLAEAGLPAFKNASWFSFFARGGTPREVIRKLEMEAVKAVNDPMVTARIRMLGAIPIASTADELDKFWKAEIEYWRPIVQRLNLQLD